MEYQTLPAPLVLFVDGDDLSPLVPLLQKGFQVRAQVGRSVRHLLCEQYGIRPEVLAERVQTLFLDGKVVDDLDTSMMKDGAVLALSAAMPGLAGASLRSGGLLSSFRDGITHEEGNMAESTHGQGLVTIKLFNLLIRELGPVFLKEGIWVRRDEAEGVVKGWLDSPQLAVHHVEKDGRKTDLETLKAIDWAREPELVVLKVLTS